MSVNLIIAGDIWGTHRDRGKPEKQFLHVRSDLLPDASCYWEDFGLDKVTDDKLNMAPYWHRSLNREATLRLRDLLNICLANWGDEIKIPG